MNDMTVVTILAFLFVLIIRIMNLLSRSTEIETRLSAVNPQTIKSDVYYATRRVIDERFSPISGDEMNRQIFLRKMAKDEENNLIVLEKERLTNQVSLLQSQLTDSDSKQRQFQNVHDELAITKTKLENNKREMNDMKEKMNNLRLTNNDSRLRRKIEDRDKIIASSAIEKNLIVLDNERLANELSLLHTKLRSSSDLQIFQNLQEELASTKSELKKQKNVSTDMKVKNLRLTDEISRLRPKIEARDKIIASTRTELEELQEKVQDVFAKTTSEFESKNKTISELETEILRLTENDSQLRRQLDRRPATTATTRETENVCQTTYPDLPPEYENPPSYGASVTARY
jgi:myosin heavy subunit